jgi:ADP-heptose:LPS heptosyltransferase/SAM-dependent methyltransferase
MNQPLVSCIMPTANRREFVPRAVEYFLRQEYARRELIVVDDGTDRVVDLMPSDARVRYIGLPTRKTVGAKRNLACEAARGEVIVHWDDDDWVGPQRLTYQVSALLEEGADLCGLDRVLFLEPARAKAWEYVYRGDRRPWIYGASLCYRKEVWRRHAFPDAAVGEDSRFVWTHVGARIKALADNRFLVAVVHPANTSPKHTDDPRWHTVPLERVRDVIGDDWHRYAAARPPDAVAPAARTALVTAAYGVGDILRVTPLVRALHQLEYAVDLLIAPDYPETVELLTGAPELRRIIAYDGLRENRGTRPIPELAGAHYDLATFTRWSMPLERWVRAERRCRFPERPWLERGDPACVEALAREVGWRHAMPAPFARCSARDFGLRPNTIALHPGCKRDWPWKKWHGFDELARLLPEVVLVGTGEDLDNRGTYFQRPFAWPAHVKSFIGELGLADTAALLKQCAALVSNDSGLMHLAAALGVPTFGIFGLTDPRREVMPSDHVFALTNEAACAPACRRRPWGSRDCERHLACLRTLSPDDVLRQIGAKLPHARPEARPSPTAVTKDASMDDISVAYYANVFDASGYGQAARAYIHALHDAGVHVSVVDSSPHGRQVRDDLVASLVGREREIDFHLFHGIPPLWAHLAFRLRNVIAMTVWETDTMPQRWRNPLNHALEVWLPCEFNVRVFGPQLERPVFRLPHPVVGRAADATARARGGEILGLGGEDFVFYAIFEWQDRKGPAQTIEAFLRAFSQDDRTVLALKCNAGAAATAARMLDESRRRTGSAARVILRCESWSDADVDALCARGDCYVSLHRGEGWGYPLFEAAARGTPVIATAYSGPLDYLSPDHHQLVRHGLASVQQKYLYYHPSMRWAEPDVGHAGEHMRWVRDHPDEARARAETAAGRIRDSHSPAAIGASARARLVRLLERTNPPKWRRLAAIEQARRRPTPPISGDWYDAGYFEDGAKSNWDRGYAWSLFADLFRETAAYLTDVFPEAHSFLDAGCAKGFLVRALRERARDAYGFDHSAWAIDHAEPAAQPFVELKSVDDVAFTRDFDVVVALSLFETLTEDQASRFLARARQRTTHALIAIIPSYADDAEMARADASVDRDLAHITMRTRAWWHDLFVRAGWRQDALHRMAQRRCQEHELPRRMQWQIYLYAP